MTDNQRISPGELNGNWKYSCELMFPGDYFPKEIIGGNEDVFANSHGGTVEISMVDKEKILLRGMREWHEIKGTPMKEDLSKPKKWNSILALTLPMNQLIYQYKISGFPNINGISHVTMIKTLENELIMNGWFYYVPSEEVFEKLKNVSHFLQVLERKDDNDLSWLHLFGRVFLTKVDNA